MRFIKIIVCILLLSLISVSGYNLFLINSNTESDKTLKADTVKFNPSVDLKNEKITNAKLENTEVAGWLNIPNTTIDYIFVRGNDNDFYLKHNWLKQKSASGAIFMDFRCNPDFTCFNTILYGHNMKNGEMFTNIVKYNDKDYFSVNNSGKIILEDKTYNIDFFALLVVNGQTDTIYNICTDETDKTAYLDFIKRNAVNYKDVNISTNDKLICLSTCSYEYKNARSILIGKIY